MNTEENSVSYEVTPCRLVAYGVPLVAPEEDFSDPKQIRIRGLTTLAASLGDAQSRAEGRLKAVKQRIRQGDHQGLVNLLDDYPEFIAHPWVRKEWIKWIATGRSFRKPGRRMGSVIRHPLIVAGMVDELVRRGWAKNKHKAFEWLDEHLCINYDMVKEQYYRAWSEERFRAVLIENPVGARSRTPDEIEHTIDQAETLESGKTITRVVEMPRGPHSATFRGL